MTKNSDTKKKSRDDKEFRHKKKNLHKKQEIDAPVDLSNQSRNELWTVLIKNCDPPEFGPAFAIERVPG
jgi:hypothetical protein